MATHDDFFRRAAYHLSLNSVVVRPVRKKPMNAIEIHSRRQPLLIHRYNLYTNIIDFSLLLSHFPTIKPLYSRQLARNIAMHSQIIEFPFFEFFFFFFFFSIDAQWCFSLVRLKHFITYFNLKTKSKETKDKFSYKILQSNM